MRITSMPEDLVEGLFGQVFLWIFEILPYLDERGIRPAWAIRSKLYGSHDEDNIVIPGLVELNYEPGNPDFGFDDLSLLQLRDRGVAILGSDWQYLSCLWNRYFRIPERIVSRANGFPSLDAALGLHYRGTDKNKALDETNYVSEADFMTLTGDFLDSHPEVRIIFIASDEASFVEMLRGRYVEYQIVSSGEATHHKELTGCAGSEKGDHAMLDCVLLSRCKYLLKCQSALSGFAKVLNPEIEAYRISANKLPDWNREIPYFPDGYLPKYCSSTPKVQTILDRLFVDDWTSDQAVFKRFGSKFKYQRRDCRLRNLRKVARRFLQCFRSIK